MGNAKSFCVTEEKVTEIINDHIEDTSAATMVAEWAKKNAGKALRSNNIPEETRIYKEKWRGTGLLLYVSNGPNFRFKLSNDITNVKVPTVEGLREMNPAYFAGAEKRNKQRQAFLNDPDVTKEVTKELCVAVKAKTAFIQALHGLEEVIYQVPDDYTLKHAVDVLGRFTE